MASFHSSSLLDFVTDGCSFLKQAISHSQRPPHGHHQNKQQPSQTDMRSRGNKFGDCYLPLISECGRETETEKAAGTFSEQPSGFRPSGVEGLNVKNMANRPIFTSVCLTPVRHLLLHMHYTRVNFCKWD